MEHPNTTVDLSFRSFMEASDETAWYEELAAAAETSGRPDQFVSELVYAVGESRGQGKELVEKFDLSGMAGKFMDFATNSLRRGVQRTGKNFGQLSNLGNDFRSGYSDGRGEQQGQSVPQGQNAQQGQNPTPPAGGPQSSFRQPVARPNNPAMSDAMSQLSKWLNDNGHANPEVQKAFGQLQQSLAGANTYDVKPPQPGRATAYPQQGAYDLR